jgi:hypothetical protein
MTGKWRNHVKAGKMEWGEPFLCERGVDVTKKYRYNFSTTSKKLTWV